MPTESSAAMRVFPITTSTVWNDESVAYLSNYVAYDSSDRLNPPIQAHSCALWYCVQTYRTRVHNGILTQGIIANHSSVTKPAYASESFASRYNFTKIPAASANIAPNTTFTFTEGTIVAFQDQDFWSVVVTFGNVEDGDAANWIYGDSDSSDSAQRSQSQSMFTVTNWEYFTDKLALSLSNNVRATGTSKTPIDHYGGQEYSQIAYVHVRWAWISFPAAMYVASVAFLIACMWDARARRVPLWKDRPLALLFCRIEEGIETIFSDPKAAEKTVVLLDLSVETPLMRKPSERSKDHCHTEHDEV